MVPFDTAIAYRQPVYCRKLLLKTETSFFARPVVHFSRAQPRRLAAASSLALNSGHGSEMGRSLTGTPAFHRQFSRSDFSVITGKPLLGFRRVAFCRTQYRQQTVSQRICKSMAKRAMLHIVQNPNELFFRANQLRDKARMRVRAAAQNLIFRRET